MKPLITLILLCAFHSVFAQVQPYGQIDTASLKLAECPFEKDANAMVLFDKAEIKHFDFRVEMIRHKRVKILNDKGKGAADIKMIYINRYGYEDIDIIAAQTINLENGKIVSIPIDKKQMYTQKVDKFRKSISLVFPAVKAGSVIEINYKWSTKYPHYPVWAFQSDIPVAHSELIADMRSGVKFYTKVKQEFTKAEELPAVRLKTPRRRWVLDSIPSYIDESFAPAAEDMLQQIAFFKGDYSTWEGIGYRTANDEDFGRQVNALKLPGTDSILLRAKQLTEKSEKVAAIFNYVKNKMLWDNTNDWYTQAGVKKAWAKKTGNSTEINLILYGLLNSAGIKSFPILVSTPDNGNVEPEYPSVSQFNKTVICVPVDSILSYVLDASDKHGNFKEVPFDLLNTYGLGVTIDLRDPTKEMGESSGKIFTIQSMIPVKKTILIRSEIKPDGKIEGQVKIADYSYEREVALKVKEMLNDKYNDYLKNDDNNLEIKSVNFENLDIDTLPLLQTIDFSRNLLQTDGGYSYFNVNEFSGFIRNPFVNKTRTANIEFDYPKLIQINGTYIIPGTHNVEAVPKNLTIKSEDGSIMLRRLAVLEDNTLSIRFVITLNRHYYSKDEYEVVSNFYKSMFEILNEPIVLRKKLNKIIFIQVKKIPIFIPETIDLYPILIT